mgnify:CR=1 FL=1
MGIRGGGAHGSGALARRQYWCITKLTLTHVVKRLSGQPTRQTFMMSLSQSPPLPGKASMHTCVRRVDCWLILLLLLLLLQH